MVTKQIAKSRTTCIPYHPLLTEDGERYTVVTANSDCYCVNSSFTQEKSNSERVEIRVAEL